MLFCDLPCHDVAAHRGALACAGVVDFLGEYIREDLNIFSPFHRDGINDNSFESGCCIDEVLNGNDIQVFV